LASLRPPRPLGFTPLLFRPPDPVIVPSEVWRPGDPRLPRGAILPMGAARRPGRGGGGGGLRRGVRRAMPGCADAAGNRVPMVVIA